jgi:hypothetical protein
MIAMNIYKHFPGIVETTYDDEKTVHKYTHYAFWYWFVRLSSILLITPIFPVSILLYLIYFYGLALAGKDINHSMREHLKVEMLGSKRSSVSPLVVTIYRGDSLKTLKSLKPWNFFLTLIKIVLIIVLVLVILFILWFLIYLIFIDPNKA